MTCQRLWRVLDVWYLATRLPQVVLSGAGWNWVIEFNWLSFRMISIKSLVSGTTYKTARAFCRAVL
jgi:hypothetical protein